MRPRRLAPLASISLLLLVSLATPVCAQRLPSTLVPEHYDLAFVVDIPGKQFEGTETIRVRAAQPTSRIVLNAAELAFSEVTIATGGLTQRAAVSVDKAAETVTLTTSDTLPAGLSEVHIRYSGTLNDKLRGFYLT